MSMEPAGKTVPAVQSEPPSKGGRTRERLLDLAYEQVIRKGFAATSIDELVEATGITKSGFFYHFRDKNDLAAQMLERFFNTDEAATRQLAVRARELSPDPLHAYLIFLKLYAEMADEVARDSPGCIIATVAFQELAFDPQVRAINSGIVERWRETARGWLSEIAEAYPPRGEVDLEALADTGTALLIGGLAIAKAMGDPMAPGRQIMIYRELIRGVFAPPRA